MAPDQSRPGPMSTFDRLLILGVVLFAGCFWAGMILVGYRLGRAACGL